jgi:hypothetical protein
VTSELAHQTAVCVACLKSRFPEGPNLAGRVSVKLMNCTIQILFHNDTGRVQSETQNRVNQRMNNAFVRNLVVMRRLNDFDPAPTSVCIS